MNVTSIYEFDVLSAARLGPAEDQASHTVPESVYGWLEKRCLEMMESEGPSWLRMTHNRGRRAVQFMSFAGVVRAPDGHQIEVLPKVGRAIGGGDIEARRLLIDMLRCLPGFRHIRTGNAKLLAARMSLPEIFVAEFLHAVQQVVKRGLRHDYIGHQDNLLALRGKLLIAPHLRQNIFRKERFFTEHDEFSANRPENRLLHTALRRVLGQTASQENQRWARELQAAFEGVPLSRSPTMDIQSMRLDRAMSHYDDALSWARLILADMAPVTGAGRHRAPSLLFPMEAVFEAFVARHLGRQVFRSMVVKVQSAGCHLVWHKGDNWFRLRPDLLIIEEGIPQLVLDTKWKLLDGSKSNGTDKYGLSQGDFYQMQAYGLSHFDGDGDVALVYPRTDAFNRPLSEFRFKTTEGLRLWVLPFCLKSRMLCFPQDRRLVRIFRVGSYVDLPSDASAA